MRLGIVDLGTNSVRFDVVEIHSSGTHQYLHREKMMIRLGQNVFLNGRLDPQAFQRTLHAFSSFKRTSKDLHVDRMIAFGTSAAREAHDVDRLLGLIRKRTGIEVKVISGEEEARLISVGVLSQERIAARRYGLIDIGGGSTELTLCRGKKPVARASFPLGTARLQQVFLKTSPPVKVRNPERKKKKSWHSSIDDLREHVRSSLQSKPEFNDKKLDLLVGSSGTIRALARALGKIQKKSKKGKRFIEREALRKLVKMMSLMNTSQLMGVPGLEPKRVDMILAGALLLEECMDFFKCKRVQVTEFSLRDGILEEEVKLAKLHTRSHVTLQLPDFYLKAKRLGCQEAHFKQVVSLSLGLFDALVTVHRLKKDWRGYLEGAAILHDSGESVSSAHHSVHSYYLVKNADFPTLENWESEFIAQLCLHHSGTKLDKKSLPFWKDKRVRTPFLVLLSILRIAEALDRGHKGQVRLMGVKRTRKEIVIEISGKQSFDLEILRVEQKKGLFEEVFNKELKVRLV